MQALRLRVPHLRLAAGLGLAFLIGVISVGTVSASHNAASASANPAGPAALRGLVRSSYRITIEAAGASGTRDILYVRGSLTIGNGSVTVTLPDNSTQAFKTDDATVVREKGQPVSISNLTNGERAMVFGTKNPDGSWTARLIRCVKDGKASS